MKELRKLAGSRRRYYYRKSIVRDGKDRPLRIPFGELKAVQLRLTEKVLNPSCTHRASYCCLGRGAIRAAKRHAKHPYLLHLDIESFFPSVTPEVVSQTFQRLGASEGVAQVLTRLVTFDGQIPQGAPSSVAVGNGVLFPLDERLEGLCRKHGLTYTRYVDDIAISGGSRLARLETHIRDIILDDGWSLGDKGGLRAADERHSYLGLIVNSKPNVDPQYVSDIRLLIGRIEAGSIEVTERELNSLEGKIRYINAVNETRGAKLLERLPALASA